MNMDLSIFREELDNTSFRAREFITGFDYHYHDLPFTSVYDSKKATHKNSPYC